MNRNGQIFVKWTEEQAHDTWQPKIPTIKAIRNLAGIPLKDAKDAADNHREVVVFEGTAKEVAKEIIKLRRFWKHVNFYTRYSDPEEDSEEVLAAKKSISVALDEIVRNLTENTRIPTRQILAEIAFQATSRYRNGP